MVSVIQDTIVKQLKAQNPFFDVEHNIKAILAMEDEKTIRLHSRGKEIVNIDITYDRGQDSYNIKAYRLRNHGLDVAEIYNEKGFFRDQLDTAIREILQKLSSLNHDLRGDSSVQFFPATPRNNHQS